MRGQGASQGIAIAKAYIKPVQTKAAKALAQDPEAETAKLYDGIAKSRQQLQELTILTESRIGAKEAQIFQAHAMILEDPELLDKVLLKIRQEGYSAAWAVHEAVEELKAIFGDIEDVYIKERILDIHDVSSRLIENIMGIKGFDCSSITEPVIIAAEELTPSEMSRLAACQVVGIITEAGGVTSHTAIMSRVMGLPAIIGAQGIMQMVRQDDVLVMNGGTGEYHINPDRHIFKQFEAEKSFQHEQQMELQQYIGNPTASKDGYRISIGCNIGSPQDLTAVLKNDGEGIGLFRSEFLYMDRSSMPTEEEQFEAYKAACAAMGKKPVIIRTLDIGGDKQLPYMDFPKEENPFLGYRAIRYCLQEKDIFRVQLRAMLRASAFGNIKIMLPMISSMEEIREAKAELYIAMQELQQKGMAYDSDIQIGIMIETPAAAMISDSLAAAVDFFSIGTNDLIQYTLAADRMNSKIANLYTPYHPAVLRLIKLTADNANKAGIWIGMCGEAAQDQLLAPLFMGMGLHELSVSPPQVLKLRKLISSLNKADMEKHVRHVLQLGSADEIQNYLKSAIQ